MHKTSKLNDGYLGSGKQLTEDIEAFGKDSFKREILHSFDCEEDMEAMEAKIVNAEFVARNDTYNVIQGGTNGYKHINAVPGLNNSAGQNLKGSQKHHWLLQNDKSYAERYKHAIKNAIKRNGASFQGKKHSEETKQKMRESSKGQSTGSRNSQFGSIWITNGYTNRKMKKTDPIPKGWQKGRVFSGREAQSFHWVHTSE